MVKALKSEFKSENPLEKRKALSEKMRRQFPNHIPIIVEKAQATAPDIKKKKFLIPEDNTLKKLVTEIRRHIADLKQDEAIFIFVGDTVPQMALTMSQLYESSKDEDGLLYVTYSVESTFGSN